MNFSVRLPSVQPVTVCTASVPQRSVSTNVISRFDIFGSRIPSRSQPKIAILTPSTCPGQRRNDRRVAAGLAMTPGILPRQVDLEVVGVVFQGRDAPAARDELRKEML